MFAPATPMAWAVVSAAVFSVSQMAVRLLSESLPSVELAFFRTIAGLVILLVSWRLLRDLSRIREPAWFAARCLLGVLAIYMFMDAVVRIPLALVSLILFSRVLMIPVLAHLVLNERPAPGVWLTASIGFAGVGLSLWPSLTLEGNVGVLSALTAALASAGSQVAVRRLVLVNNTGLIVVGNAAAAALLLSLPAAAVWTSPPVADLPVLAALGISAVFAQYAAARAFAKVQAAHVAMMDFLTVPIAAAGGFLVFGEVPSAYVLAGSVPVLASALAIARKERTR